MNPGKVFVGGIDSNTTEENLKEYFESKYGEVKEVVIMRDRNTRRCRGFGFIVFVDPSILDNVIRDQHSIDGRTVEVKRAFSREEQQASIIQNHPIRKIFVGGLPNGLEEADFRGYFQTYGNVTDFVIMYDHASNRPRGFGFVTFDSDDAVRRVLQNSFHSLKNKMVHVKLAIPKEVSSMPQGLKQQQIQTPLIGVEVYSSPFPNPIYVDYYQYQYQPFGPIDYPPLVTPPYDYVNGQYHHPLVPYGYGNDQYSHQPFVPSGYGYDNGQYNQPLVLFP